MGCKEWRRMFGGQSRRDKDTRYIKFFNNAMHLTLFPANWGCSWISSGFSIWYTATAAAWRHLGTVYSTKVGLEGDLYMSGHPLRWVRRPNMSNSVRARIQVRQARSILHAKLSRPGLLCTMTATNSHLYRPGSLGSGMNLDGFHPCLLVLGDTKGLHFGSDGRSPPPNSNWRYEGPGQKSGDYSASSPVMPCKISQDC
jgi:hypothetical protein